MPTRLSLVSLLVPDYDEALAFFLPLGFVVREDTDLGAGKRWVRIGCPGAQTSILLARAEGPQEVRCVGEQGGGRVWLFLETADLATDRAAFETAGVAFEGPTRHEAYGRVAVFCDPWGNRWDLIEPIGKPLDEDAATRGLRDMP